MSYTDHGHLVGQAGGHAYEFSGGYAPAVQGYYAGNGGAASTEMLLLVGILVMLLCMVCGLITGLFGIVGGYVCGRFVVRGAADDEREEDKVNYAV